MLVLPLVILFNKGSEVTSKVKLFSSKLEWRIKQYDCNIDKVIDWANEVYIHENYNYNHTSFIKRNKDKKKVVKNYNDLYKIYEEKKEIIESIENRVLSKVTND